jgi:hypothetical protein
LLYRGSHQRRFGFRIDQRHAELDLVAAFGLRDVGPDVANSVVAVGGCGDEER